MKGIIGKLKLLIFCWYKGHVFGVTRYMDKSELRICAKCGYKKTVKFPSKNWDDYEIY